MSQRWIPQREEWYVKTGSMLDNPWGVPRDEVVRMIKEMPAEMVAQVCFGKYVELSGLVFTGELIQQMIDRRLPRVRSNTWLDEPALREAQTHYGDGFVTGRPEHGGWGYRYHTGVDFGRQTDFTVLITIDTIRMPAKLVYYRRLNRVPWEELYTEVGKARWMFGPNIKFDGSGPAGDVIWDALESRAYCPVHKRTLMVGEYCQRDGEMLGGCSQNVYLPLSCCDPFIFSAASKRELVEHLRNVMAHGYNASDPEAPFGRLRVPPIQQLEEEMSFYAWDDKKLTTDVLFSLALAAWSGLEDQVGEPFFGSPFGA